MYLIFGIDIIYGLLLNLFLMTYCIILTGKVTFLLLSKHPHRRIIASYSMILIALVPVFISSGVLLLKDVFIMLGVLLIANNYLKITKQKIRTGNFLGVLLGVIFF